MYGNAGCGPYALHEPRTKLSLCHIQHSKLFNSLDLVPTMDTDKYNADEEDEDGALMDVLLMVVLHNNMCTMRHIMKKRAHQQQHGICLPWSTNQDYRHLPRQGKRIFRHIEALVCIRRDYFGIPGDLSTPILRDQNFEMMFRLSRSRVQRILKTS